MTTTEKIALSGVQETLLITLYAKARESLLPDSLLRDRFAAEIVSRLDYDFARLQVGRDDMIGLAIRADTLDAWTRDFIRRHPEATILHLGCGLDSRVFRIDPPAGIRWFDIDYPEIIALRRKLYPEREGTRPIGSSVTDPGWLEAVPADRPAMVIAEGLVMYLHEREVGDLFRALAAHLPEGEMAFDAFSRLGMSLAQHNRMIRATGATFHWSLDDPADLERLVPGLQFLAEQVTYDPARPAQFERFSLAARLAIRLMIAVPAFRRMGRLLRYRF